MDRKKPKFKTERQVWNFINREIERLEGVRKNHLDPDFPLNLRAAISCEEFITSYEILKDKMRNRKKSIWDEFGK